MFQSTLVRMGAKLHTAASVAASLRATWFTIQHDASVSAYSTGVLPGDPEADLLFTMVIKEALDTIHRRLQDSELLPPLVQLQGPREFSAGVQHDPDLPADISYVDDAVFVVTQAADRIAAAASAACAIIQEVFEDSYMLPVNFKPGKTEVVIAFAGKGARHAKIDLYINNGCRLQHVRANRTIDVYVTHAYKHLGAMMASSGRMLPEIQNRCRSMAVVVSEYASSFYKSDHFTVETKKLTFEPLLISRLLLNAATWPPLTAAEKKKLNGKYLKAVYLIAGTTKDDFARPHVVSNALARAKVPSCEQMLRIHRLRYLPRLLTKTPAFVLVRVDAVGEMRSLFIEDLVWLCSMSNSFSHMPQPATDLVQWLELCKTHPGFWKAAIRAVKEKLVSDEALAAAGSPTRDDVLRQDVDVMPPDVAACYECGAVFKNMSAVHCHARRVHGARSQHADAVHDGTFCLCCPRDFRTLDRLLQHLGRTACYARISAHVRPSTADERLLLEVANKKARKANRRGDPVPFAVRLPTARICGPLCSWAV